MQEKDVFGANPRSVLWAETNGMTTSLRCSLTSSISVYNVGAIRLSMDTERRGSEHAQKSLRETAIEYIQIAGIVSGLLLAAAKAYEVTIISQLDERYPPAAEQVAQPTDEIDPNVIPEPTPLPEDVYSFIVYNNPRI